MAEVKTQRLRKELHLNFLKKAGECAALMRVALEQGGYNAAAILAVHCGISAADALTVFSLGVRHAGTNHADVQRLLMQVADPLMGQKLRHLAMLLGIKGVAEYEERLITETNARDAVTHAERFLSWVQGKVGE